MGKKVSVEYAHIYTNQRIAEEQKLSLEVLSRVKYDLSASRDEVSLVVMVDDYSFPDPTFEYDSYTKFLESNGFKPDIVLRESALIPLCDQVISVMADDKLKFSIIEYVRAKKYPCSLFIAAWYLLRLGLLTQETFKKSLQSDKLINILPESFKPFEDKAIEIISSTKYFDCISMIENMYFEGRLIA